MKILKKFIPTVLKNNILRSRQFLKYRKVNKNYLEIEKELEKTYDEKRILLIGTSIFPNVGDQAIAIAQMEILEDTFPNFKIIEIPISLYKLKYKKLAINEKDLITINGGGYMGNLWLDAQEVIDLTVTHHPLNHIIIFPQTVYYKDDVKNIIEHHKEIYRNHKNITLFVRDKASYDFVKANNFIFKNIYLTPDIVTYLDANKFKDTSNIINFVLRGDQERISNNKKLNKIKSLLTQIGVNESDIIFSDTIAEGVIDYHNRDEVVTKYLKNIGVDRLTVSDRLHGVMLSAISGIPTIALDNVTKKTFGAFEWLKELGYVVYQDDEDLEDRIGEFISNAPSYSYDREIFHEHHNLIKQVLIAEYGEGISD